jgi:hypothetical protein
MCSPVKFAHSLPKKCRNTSNWELCVICQINTPDSLSCATENGRDTLFDDNSYTKTIKIKWDIKLNSCNKDMNYFIERQVNFIVISF